MVVTIRLLGLREYHPDPDSSEDGFSLSVDKHATVRTVIEKLKIPDALPKTILVNRLHAQLDGKLQDGDVVSVLQPVAGG